MREAQNITELRQGIEQIDLDDTLGSYDVDIDQIREALLADRFEDAKAMITDVLGALQASSSGGFPIGVEMDLADLVGFNY